MTLVPYYPVNIVKANIAYVAGVHLQKHVKGTKWWSILKTNWGEGGGVRQRKWFLFPTPSPFSLTLRFFSGYSGFPLSLKTNISKFQFDFGMHGHFWTSSCELLSAPLVNKLHLHFFKIHITPFSTYPYFLLNPGVLVCLLDLPAWETERKSLLGRVTQNLVTCTALLYEAVLSFVLFPTILQD